MTTTTGLQSYYQHTLNITLKTSSGDVINMDLNNEKSALYASKKDQNGTSDAFSFSSMQEFSFSIEGNGLDEQDKKEIAALMKVTQPYIDNFIDELAQDAPKSPVTKVAKEIASLFNPYKESNSDTKNTVQSSLVKGFDNALEKLTPQKQSRQTQEELIAKVFENAKKLLEDTLKLFNQNENEAKLYA